VPHRVPARVERWGRPPRPALTAKLAMDLDRLSGGRFDLGIGAGWNADEHAMVGLDYPAYA